MNRIARCLGLGLLTWFLGWGILAITAPPLYADFADLTIAEIVVQTPETTPKAAVILTFPTSLVAELDTDGDGSLSRREIRRQRAELTTFIREHFILRRNGTDEPDVEVAYTERSIVSTGTSQAARSHSTIAVTYRWPEPLERLTIQYRLFDDTMPIAHCLATVQYSDEVKTLLLDRSNPDYEVKVAGTPADRLLALGWAIALPMAFLWGSAHALSPGHGKTTIGAYLVGTRATPWHAVLLGLTTAFTHTAVVFALGLLALVASQYILPEQLFPWLSLASGLLVLGLGLLLVRQRWRSLAHPHPHHHAHHPHHHAHHDHNLDGATWRSVLTLGISGGLTPCPAALILLLATFAVGRALWGLALVSAFSLGLALALTVLGLLLIGAKQLFERVPGQVKFARWLSFLSAVLITGLGSGIALHALWQLVG